MNINEDAVGSEGQTQNAESTLTLEEEQEDEFSKPMQYLYDLEELNQRRKESMQGNMYLITELYIAKQLNGNIIKTCLEDLQVEVNNQNVEILCYMLTKLMTNCLNKPPVEPAKQSYLQVPAKHSTKEITLEFIERVL